MNRYRVTRITKTHAWVRNTAYGPSAQGQRGLSMRMPVEDFNANWERLPMREVRRKKTE